MTDTTGSAGEVVSVTDATYHDMVLNCRERILVAFTAEADSTCRALRPILHDLARERAGRLIVATVDVAANPAVTHSWGVSEVPVMLLFDRGVLERVLRGVRPYARLVREIDEVPSSSAKNPASLKYAALLQPVDGPPSQR